MMRSLAVKLTLVIVLVGLLGVAVVAIFAQQATRREFSKFVTAQMQADFVEQVGSYYRSNGTWDGLLDALPRPRPGPEQGPPPAKPGDRPDPPPPRPNLPPPPNSGNANFILFDDAGCVITPIPPYRPADCLEPEQFADGEAVMVDGERVGIVLTHNLRPGLGGIERAYLNAINNAIRNATIAATALALVLGLLLARYLTRPLNELTKAIRAMTRGELKQEVQVRSQDEIGELAMAFNQMSEDVAHANYLRRQMTADIAHDLRNPLGVLSGYIESMRDGVLEPTAERLQTMQHETNHLKHLVDDLWTLARADAGELPLMLEAMPVTDLLDRVAATYTDQVAAKQIDLHLSIPPDIGAIQIDRERMAQVLGNLMHNALRYTPEGGQIELSATANIEHVVIAVRDNGSGIDAEALPLIFERFYRADSARVLNNGESGLGLAIAKMIVTAHGGEISAESEPNVETTFRVQLPR